jgi:hypothetical protein
MRSFSIVVAALIATLLFCDFSQATPISAQFTLLGDSSFAGHKPQPPLPATGDWLVGTADDDPLAATYNPNGSLSHNLADLGGNGGSGMNQAPSLSGSLTLQFSPTGAETWDVSVTALGYTGTATPVMLMNQFLVTAGSPPTQNAAFNVDGVGNNGTWQSSATADWAVDYDLDFYFATNADGDPSNADVDATFNDKSQIGHLIPVSALTLAGLVGVSLDDPAGFFAGDFEDYLLNTVVPLLPPEATYLLFTQMAKTSPGYTEAGLPITTSSLIGNTTIAYTTDAVPEPGSLALLGVCGAALTARRRRTRGDCH